MTSDVQHEQNSRAAYIRWAKQTAPAGEPGEEWRDVPSYPGYQASTLGRVRSRYAILRGARRKRTGHIYVCPSVAGRQAPEAVHRMVCEAFHGPCPPGMECRHDDGNSANNLPGNLLWGTRLENMRDKERHGTENIGERNGRAKLTTAQMQTLRQRGRNGASEFDLAQEYGVSVSHARNLIAGRRGRKL